MAVDVLATIAIERPQAEVAAYAGDPSNAPEWYRRIGSAEWITDPPVRLGSRVRFHATLPRPRSRLRLRDRRATRPTSSSPCRPPRGPFPMRTTYTWRALSDRATHMTLRNQGEPTGFARLGSPVHRSGRCAAR